MKDLRPIALCNILYKIMAKVLANRLKNLLPGLISENQSAFVRGRSITNNVLRKHNDIDDEVGLKLDISKAYKRVSLISKGYDEEKGFLFKMGSMDYDVGVYGFVFHFF